MFPYDWHVGVNFQRQRCCLLIATFLLAAPVALAQDSNLPRSANITADTGAVSSALWSGDLETISDSQIIPVT